MDVHFLNCISQYMLILFLLFLIQFSIACACLAVNTKQQEQLAEQVNFFPPEGIAIMYATHRMRLNNCV